MRRWDFSKKPHLWKYLKQIILGALIAMLGISLQALIGNSLETRHTLFFFPTFVMAILFGSGLLSGISATIVSSTALYYFFLSSSEQQWREKGFYGFISILGIFSIGILFLVLLRRSERNLRELSDRQSWEEEVQCLKFAAMSARVGIWEWDIPNDKLKWDDQMLELYGLDRSSFSNTVESWRKGLHPADAERATAAAYAALRGEKDYNIEFRVRHPDGKERILHASALVIRDSQGRAKKMFGLNRDVTEEKRSLERLQEMKSFFEAALAQSQAGIVILDGPSRQTKFVNEAAMKILDIKDSEGFDLLHLYSRKKYQVSNLEGEVVSLGESPIEKAIQLGEHASQEMLLTSSEGLRRVILTNTAPIRRPDGSIMAGIAVLFDMTERHRLLEQLRAAREDAEVASRAKSKFLDIAAHELRTPVTAFSLLLQLTQMRLEKGHPVDLSVLTRLRSQVNRLSRLVTDLLEVSRLDRGLVQLKVARTDIKSLMADCCANFRMQFPHREIRLSTPSEAVELEADPVRIYEVISNLIDNALKYSPDHSPIDVLLASSPEKIRVMVKDQGPGIPKDRQSTLFKAFERGVLTGEERHAGLGLGLFICRGIIELHKGEIGVQSEAGEGTTFYFDLPRTTPLSQVAS